MTAARLLPGRREEGGVLPRRHARLRVCAGGRKGRGAVAGAVPALPAEAQGAAAGGGAGGRAHRPQAVRPADARVLGGLRLQVRGGAHQGRRQLVENAVRPV